MAKAPLHVATVCTGNICRSPMAEVLLKQVVADDPTLAGHVLVTSAGTARWHVGDLMDPRAQAALHRAGLWLEGSPARYADRAYLDEQDLVLVMTRDHVREVAERLTNPDTVVALWRDVLSPGLGLEVADPYYGDDDAFDDCLGQLRQSVPHWKEEFRRRRGADSREV